MNFSKCPGVGYDIPASRQQQGEDQAQTGIGTPETTNNSSSVTLS